MSPANTTASTGSSMARVDGLVQGVQEVVQAGVEAGLGVDAAVVLHADVDVGEVQQLDHAYHRPVVTAEEISS